MDAAKIAREGLVDLIGYRRDRFGLIADVFARESSDEAVARTIARAADFSRELDESLELALGRGLASLACDDMASFAVKTRTEYARLFLGPREVVAPLHESAYLSGTPRMFTAETLAVRRFYESCGQVMKAKNKEPEDGIALEFEFLRNLCSRCIALLEAEEADHAAWDEAACSLKAQKAFKEQHLGRWARDFAKRVVDGDRSGYYAIWATYLIGVLDEDEGLLGECEQLMADIGGVAPVSA